MSDPYDRLVDSRPTRATDLLPVGTAEHVSEAIRRDRRDRRTRMVAVGLAAAMLVVAAGQRILPASPSTTVAGTPTAPPSLNFVTPTPVVGSAKVVTTPRVIAGSAAPAALSARRVGTGTLMTLNDGSTKLCVKFLLDVHSKDAWTCSTFDVAGVTWDQIPWAQTPITGRWADVDFIGLVDTHNDNATVVVDTIAPAGTFTMTTDKPAATGYPAMTCLRSSGTGSGGSLADPLAIPGYQGSWTESGTLYVAATGDPATVEAQVRAGGFGGALCVGRLTTPTEDALSTLEPSQPGDWVLASQVAYNGGAHIAYQVLANVPGLQERLLSRVAARWPDVGVDVTPVMLVVTS